MRSISTCAVVASLFVAFAACGPKQDPSQQPATAPTGTAPYGYPQQPGAYPQQPGAYPQPTATYPQPGTAPPGYAPTPGAPTAAPPATAGQLSVPGPASFIQCSNDVPCGSRTATSSTASASSRARQAPTASRRIPAGLGPLPARDAASRSRALITVDETETTISSSW